MDRYTFVWLYLSLFALFIIFPVSFLPLIRIRRIVQLPDISLSFYYSIRPITSPITPTLALIFPVLQVSPVHPHFSIFPSLYIIVIYVSLFSLFWKAVTRNQKPNWKIALYRGGVSVSSPTSNNRHSTAHIRSSSHMSVRIGRLFSFIYEYIRVNVSLFFNCNLFSYPPVYLYLCSHVCFYTKQHRFSVFKKKNSLEKFPFDCWHCVCKEGLFDGSIDLFLILLNIYSFEFNWLLIYALVEFFLKCKLLLYCCTFLLLLLLLFLIPLTL